MHIPTTFYDVSFVPGLGFNLFSFHVVRENHGIILNKVGAHLMDGQATFPRKENGLYIRTTRLSSGLNVIALVTF